jgi:hypothetical protein
MGRYDEDAILRVFKSSEQEYLDTSKEGELHTSNPRIDSLCLTFSALLQGFIFISPSDEISRTLETEVGDLPQIDATSKFVHKSLAPEISRSETADLAEGSTHSQHNISSVRSVLVPNNTGFLPRIQRPSSTLQLSELPATIYQVG